MGEILTALALVFVLEGIMPFVSPGTYKSAMSQICKTPNQTLRTIGLCSMLLGVGLLYLFH